jgi:hypothetical protein
MAELKATGLDDSVNLGEIVAAVAEASGCRTGKITAGVLRTAPRVLGSM